MCQAVIDQERQTIATDLVMNVRYHQISFYKFSGEVSGPGLLQS